MADELLLLFSKPLFVSEIKTEVDISKLKSLKWKNNRDNQITVNKNVLNEEIFKELSIEINSKIFEYFYGIMRHTPETEIYVTTSWLNKTEKDEEHHEHSHPNSILSGVVNLFGDSNAGGDLSFISNEYQTIDIGKSDYNLCNSPTWSIPFVRNRIMIFPSSTRHLVKPYFGEEPRITLSFNTFVRGDIWPTKEDITSRLTI